MNKSYIEWIDYYENATKEDVIQDMMLDINSIKEKDKEIEKLNNIIDELERFLKYEIYCDFNKEMTKGYQDTLDKLNSLKEGK